MGILNLFRNITANAPGAKVLVSWEQVRGWIIAIDTSIFQYAALSKDQAYIEYVNLLLGKGSDADEKGDDSNGVLVGGDDVDADEEIELKSILKLDRKSKRKGGSSGGNSSGKGKVTFQDEVDPAVYDKHHPDHHKHVKVQNHMRYMRDIIKHCDEFDIKPIFIFDGKPPDCKKNTLIKYHGNEDIRIHYLRQRIRIELMTYFECLGIAYMVAPSEAEAQAAHLVKLGVCNAVVTRDGDALTFGANIVWRSFTEDLYAYKYHRDANKKYIALIYLDIILTQYDFTYEQFVDYCILCGCDYECKIEGCGSVRALALIREYVTIEKAAKRVGKLTDKLRSDAKTARNEFINHNVCNLPSRFDDYLAEPLIVDYSLGKAYWKQLGISIDS